MNPVLGEGVGRVWVHRNLTETKENHMPSLVEAEEAEVSRVDTTA